MNEDADDPDASSADLRALGRVLVTGAAGRIGTATVRRLVRAGVAVTALDRVEPADSPADRVLVGDVTDADVVAGALDGVGAVVHLAAIPTPVGHEPYDVFRDNTDATFNVLDQAGALGIRRAVIASSINATGVPFNPHDILPAYYPIDEDLPIDLADAYSLSKQVDEHTARMIARRDGMTVVALRFPLTSTPEGIERGARDACERPWHAAREGWSYLDLRDAAEAVALALIRPLQGAVVLCIAAPDTITGQDAADLLHGHAHGVPVHADVFGTMSLYSAARAREILGWMARHPRRGRPRKEQT